jgi:hypothetical protein
MSEIDRFRKFEGRPPALPACSFFSRTDDDDYFIDTGTQIEEGAIYIGARDAEAIARAIEWIEPDKYTRLLNAYKKMEEDYNVMAASVAALDSVPDLLRDTVKAIREARRRSTTTSPTILPGSNELDVSITETPTGLVEQATSS